MLWKNMFKSHAANVAESPKGRVQSPQGGREIAIEVEGKREGR